MKKSGLALLLLTSCTFLGQLPRVADRDADGISDDIEVQGINITLPTGGTKHLDLKADGASANHKDIFVWIDWMGNKSGDGSDVGHSHKPSASALATVVSAFAAAPIKNLDNQNGIAVHFLVSDTPIPHEDLLGPGGNTWESGIWSEFDTIKNARFPKELRNLFHYCLFVHDVNIPQRLSTTGIARGIGGYDLIVSLGEYQNHYGNDDEQAGTLMHELGHNLGLQHGGGDDQSGKPNYLSVMSYAFQTDGLLVPRGLPDYRRFDYSRLTLAHLDESNLDETAGITSDVTLKQYGSRRFCENVYKTGILVSIVGSVAWDCDPSARIRPNVKADINGDGKQTDLPGFNDWQNISLVPIDTSRAGSARPLRLSPLTELSLAEANRITLPSVRGLKAAAENGSVKLEWSPIRSSRIVAYSVARTLKGKTEAEFTTENSTFTDLVSSGNTQYTYVVTAKYLPHGASTNININAEDAGGNGKFTVGLTRNPTHMFGIIMDRGLIEDLQKNAPGAMAKIRGDNNYGPENTPKVLLETAPAAVTVKVQ
jgi:hypothetical protein